MKRIIVSDITLRECEQEQASKLSFKEKQEIAKLLEKLNVDVIETGYLGDKPADAVFIRMLAQALEQSILCVPVSANRESIDKAWAALSKAKKPRLNLIIPTSVVGMEFECHLTPEQELPLISELIKYAKTLCNDVEFTAQDATRSERAYLAQVLKAAIAAGAGTVTLGDSGGELLPEEISELTSSMLQLVPELADVTFSVHLKDHIDLAAATALCAVRHGIDMIKVCAGNISDTLSLESFLNILKIRGDSIGITGNLNTTSHQRIFSGLAAMTGAAGTVTGRKSASDDSKSGKSDAVLPENAEISQLRSYIKKIGYDISEEDLENIFGQFKDIARNKNVVADDIEALIAETAGQAPPTYKLKNYVINSGSSIAATAYIEFEKNGTVSVALSAGDGPIDAAFKAAESIFGTRYELEDFRINAVTSGREATGDALVKLRCDGKLYSGRGVSTDIVGASIRAYLSAVNKILNERT